METWGNQTKRNTHVENLAELDESLENKRHRENARDEIREACNTGWGTREKEDRK